MDKSDLNFNYFLCCDKEMARGELLEHMKEAHGVNNDALCTRHTVGHLDATEWFQTNYTWTMGDLVFYQFVRTERAKDDIMRFLDE